jgi:Family of unknown function (DUF6062)/HEAT repeats
MVSFCPNCWNEVGAEAGNCPVCGADLALEDARPFVEKLRRALFHPEPGTASRAAWILGERGEQSAVPDLIRVLETTPDGYLAEAAAASLGTIGDRSALEALERAAEHGTVRTRLAARGALERIGGAREESRSLTAREAGGAGLAHLRKKKRAAGEEMPSLERSLPLTWNAFEAAFEREGCPICDILRGWEERSLFSFLYEGMMNPEARQQFLDGGGFCARHFWAATHLGINFWSVGTLEVANLCAPLVASAEKGIDEGAGKTSRPGKALVWRRKAKAQPASRGAACMFCGEVKAEEQSLIEILEQLVSDEAFGRRIADQGLCLPHFQRAIAEWKRPARREWLVQVARERIAALAHDLKELIRKYEHRYRDEPIGREADIVRRAMEFLIGFDSRLPGSKAGWEKNE